MEMLYQDHLRKCLTNQMQALNNYRPKFSSSIIPHKQWFSFFFKEKKTIYYALQSLAVL